MSSINNTILSVTRRTTKGFTVGEIFDRVVTRLERYGKTVPAYSTVRARVYELAASGSLARKGARKDSFSGFRATTFVRN